MPTPSATPTVPDDGNLYDRGFSPRGCGSVFCICDCSELSVRWAEGGSGVRRARDPDCVVMRTGEEEGDSGSEFEEDGRSVTVEW